MQHVGKVYVNFYIPLPEERSFFLLEREAACSAWRKGGPEKISITRQVKMIPGERFPELETAYLDLIFPT